jgi:hypothetical protein
VGNPRRYPTWHCRIHLALCGRSKPAKQSNTNTKHAKQMNATQEQIYRAGNIELTANELQTAIDKGETAIVGFRTVWSISQSNQGLFQIVKVYTERGNLPLTPKGRFQFANGTLANRLIGFELFTA